MTESTPLGDIVSKLIDPLSAETRNLFRPLKLRESDRLKIQLSKDEQFSCTLTGVDENLRYSQASYYSTHFWQRLPSKKVITDFSAVVPATDISALLFRILWNPKHLIIAPKAKLLYANILLRFARQTELARNVAEFRTNHELPEFNLWDAEELPLAPYQLLAYLASKSQEGYGLFMEQGTGKTPIVIARICNEAREKGGNYRAIIVCPKNVRLNWQKEFARFATCKGKVTVVRGGKLTRIKCLIDATQTAPDDLFTVVVCSYDSVGRTWEGLGRIPWDLAVADESHYIKNPKAQRSKALLKLRDISKQRMVLTGTPIANSLMDLFQQFEFLGKGFSGFQTYKAFRNYHANFERRNGQSVYTGYRNVPFLQERLARCSYMVRLKDVLPELPEKVYSVTESYMSPEQSKIYKDVATMLMAEIESELDGVETAKRQMVLNNSLTKLLRLAQITSGFVVWDGEVDDFGEEVTPKILDRFDPNPKVEALVALLKELPEDSKALVWCHFVQDIKTIKARLDIEGIDTVTYYGGTSDKDRETAELRYNTDPACKVFLGNAAAGGTGLNLLGYPPGNGDDYKTNTTHCIYYSQGWSLTARSQSEGRPFRRGTRTHVQYVDLVVPGTIDEEIRVRVVEKGRAAMTLTDVRQVLKRLLTGINETREDV